MAYSLAGKVALVTGSASGIGAAIARELAARGASVIITYLLDTESDKASDIVLSLPDPEKAIAIQADLSTVKGPEQLATAAARHFGRIDILINNAAVMGRSSLETSSEALASLFDQAVAVNGRGTLLLTQAVLRYLSPKDSRIINICSETSRNPEPDTTVYAGTKGMIESMTRCWAMDLPRKYGCTVNAVSPGPVSTETVLAAPEGFLKSLLAQAERTPVAARMAKPEEVAWTVAMLCEGGASWLNGVYIPVCGGLNFN